MTPEPPAAAHQPPEVAYQRPAVSHPPIALVDLLDRLLAGGVVISGEIRLSIAGIDMVTISLQALISSVSTALRTGTVDGTGSVPGQGSP